MRSALDNLRDDGVAMLPVIDVAPIVAHLKTRPQHPGHVKVYPHEQNSSCYEMRDLLSAPGFLSYALGFTDMVAEYLGVETPNLYSVNAFWTFPNGGANIEGLQTMHADGDDENFVAMFILGTDVLREEDGAHRFTMRNGVVTTILGSAGMVFIEDPRQPHMGIKPQTQPRLLMWARWGVSHPPRSYGWDQLSPVPAAEVPEYPADERLRKSIELVAR